MAGEDGRISRDGTCLIRERTMTTFISCWKLLMDFLLKEGEKMNLLIYGLDDWKG